MNIFPNGIGIALQLMLCSQNFRSGQRCTITSYGNDVSETFSETIFNGIAKLFAKAGAVLLRFIYNKIRELGFFYYGKRMVVKRLVQQRILMLIAMQFFNPAFCKGTSAE